MAECHDLVLQGRSPIGLLLQLLPQAGCLIPDLLSTNTQLCRRLPQGLLVPLDLAPQRLVLDTEPGEIQTFRLHNECVLLSEIPKALILCPGHIVIYGQPTHTLAAQTMMHPGNALWVGGEVGLVLGEGNTCRARPALRPAGVRSVP